jgi:ATP-dependent DNA helicase RecG
VQQGRQAYVVCPLVEESEKMDLRAAQETYEHLSQKVFVGLRVGLLHGRLKTAEKEEVMTRFAANETHILVTTTVIEGVSMWNASVMRHAERFGRPTHQLRGRIGRGTTDPPVCHAWQEADRRGRSMQCMIERRTGLRSPRRI